jgi:transcriptional regulator with XRE-family HTH domain
MFSDNLADALLRFFGETNMSYETASELCHLSERTICNIACRRSVASIASLEKLCKGFGKTPNELLSKIDEQQAVTYRFPMAVSTAKIFRSSLGYSSFPVCPRCSSTLVREYQAYCDRCGQCLGWDFYPKTDE